MEGKSVAIGLFIVGLIVGSIFLIMHLTKKDGGNNTVGKGGSGITNCAIGPEILCKNPDLWQKCIVDKKHNVDKTTACKKYI